MDISDKNFKPCPCGYQICQFCYNNIRQNPELNGRCPACRRLYDDESVEYKLISPEEYRLQQNKRERREREKKQREKEKKEFEMANKKHLAGLRVVQKNLVYVTGLSPPCLPDDLHAVLRSDKYFGQYGKILKIVINRKMPALAANPAQPGIPLSVQPSGHAAMGGGGGGGANSGLVVYVTFARKEDALKCINELDGSMCDGRVLRAAHGTTKYCSLYLRGHPCPNPNCMFLHEPGEEADLYTRKDLLTQQGIKMGMMGMTASALRSAAAAAAGAGAAHASASSSHDYSDDDNTISASEDDDHVDVALHTGIGAAAAAAAATAALPATAHWAKGSNSASVSPAVNNNAALANAAAFPTLGEIVKENKAQARDKRTRQKAASQILLPDDVDIDDYLAVQFTEDTASHLKSLADKRKKLAVHFDALTASMAGRPALPLFAVQRGATHATLLDEEKVIARRVIERFILRPLKNYHLAYQNHPISQQQAMQVQLQQQQQQQLQAQTPQTQMRRAEHHDEYQQHVLLLQLQQLQYVLQYQGPAVNMLRMAERGSNATPPPPGLFAAGKPQQAPAAAAASQSSSSQLLTQLMSGKK